MFLRSVFVLLAACSDPTPPSRPGGDGGVDAGPVPCTPGEVRCDDRFSSRCAADGITREEVRFCPDACIPRVGCRACEPYARRCNGTVSELCSFDGTRWTPVRDCAATGVECAPIGVCDDACGVAEANRSYAGCEFWAAPLRNDASAQFLTEFVLAVTNAGEAAVDVTVDRGGFVEERVTIEPRLLVEIGLSWVDEHAIRSGPNEAASTIVADAAYRVISTGPVTVSQYNPRERYGEIGNEIFSADASMLLPSTTLGPRHVVLSYVPYSNHDFTMSGYVAIVGTTEEPANVVVETTTDVAPTADGRIPLVPAGGTVRLTLQRGEVAHVVARSPERCSLKEAWCERPDRDPSGSVVRSDLPVVVFGGHDCVNVPLQVPACDHLEEQLAPDDSWGTRFAGIALGELGLTPVNLLRFVGSSDANVTLTRADGTTETFVLAPFEFGETWIDGAYALVSDVPIEVAQYLSGQEYGGDALRGDPSLVMVTPAEQFESQSWFALPSTYDGGEGQSYLAIARPAGVAVRVDGVPITTALWHAIGEFEVAIVLEGPGAHRIDADEPIGVIAYGIGAHVSFAHPVGAARRIVAPE